MQTITLCQLGGGSTPHVSIDVAMAYGDKTGRNYTVCVDGRLYFSRLLNTLSGLWTETWYKEKAKVK